MNPAHLHLLTNHIPVLGTIFGLLVLAAGLIRRSEEVQRVGMAALVLVALVAIPVYLTGGSAEGVADGLPGVSEAVIEPHESAATLALIVLGITGALALIGLVTSRGARRLPRPLTMLVLALAVVSGGLMARTANLGGRIRHTEIRRDIAAPDTAPVEHEDDD